MAANIRQLVSRHRRTRIARSLGAVCRRFIKWTENYNYDFATNGEQNVLWRLQGTDMRTIFDVGSNVGEWAAMARKCFPKTHIHCFEVVKDTAEQLTRRMGHDGNITINTFGLGDAARECRIKYYPDAPPLSSLLDYPHQRPATFVTGMIRRGDDYIREHSIDHIDFLKIDVEGFEKAVLDGFQQALSRRCISIIQFEYGTANILSRFLLHDAYDHLTELGYVLGKLYPQGVEFRAYSFEHEDFIGPNYVAVLSDRDDLIRRLC